MKRSFSTTASMVWMILIGCLLTAFAQGTSFFYCSHYTKVCIFFFLFVGYLSVFAYLKLSNRLNEKTICCMLVLLGILLRTSFVLLSGLYERQHDAGAYTGIATDTINPGHIGYIEFIYKFHKLPDINPYELFAYYHPPLHHILSYLFLQINIWLGVPEALAFENLQILPLLYSCFCMVVTYRILKTLEIDGRGLYLGLLFVVLHPSTIYMSGSVNNDMLTILFMCLIMLGSFQWIRDKSLKSLIKLALYIGFGMITKLNAAALAIPLGLLFLLYLFQVLREGSRPLIGQTIRNFCIFAAIVVPLGLCWVVRNLLRFGEKPGVPVPGETNPMYTAPYSLWERLGIPTLADWNFAFPFHPISARACRNTWVIMFHTSIFAEEYPTNLSDLLLVMCQYAFFLTVFFGIITTILLFLTAKNKKTLPEDRIFLLFGYIVILVSFAAFVIKYPYTCSSDFRYIAISIVYIAIAIALGNKYYIDVPAHTRKEKLLQSSMHIINFGIVFLLLLLTIINQFWGRW